MIMCNEVENICPLLKNPETYNPDTVDLSANSVERDYWLPTIENLLKRTVNKAEILYPNSKKGKICIEKFHKFIEDLKEDRSTLQPLSIRTLLLVCEEVLREHGFGDCWSVQKHKESLLALSNFPNRIAYLDSIDDSDLKWYQIAKGMLAGNIFDWGSTAVREILESMHEFSFQEVLKTIDESSWFRNDLDKWIQKNREMPYRSAFIFVDNAGIDFVLGMLPFARQLLILGTKVTLCANTHPALNDITYPELQLYVCKAAEHCQVLKNAVISNQLVFAENGQKGPCLDLRCLPPELCQSMHTADLIVLEGMGRAVQTNLFAKFNVDSLKVAVLKNEWLAKSLGAKPLSVMFNFETVP